MLPYALRFLIFVIYFGLLAALVAGAIAVVRAMHRERTADRKVSRLRWFSLWMAAQAMLAADLCLILTLPAARRFVLDGHFVFEHGSRARIYLLPAAFLAAAAVLGALVIAVARTDR